MKLCKDCKHLWFEGQLTEENAYCNKNHQMHVSPVTGKVFESMRPSCSSARTTGECGKEAKHWEPK